MNNITLKFGALALAAAISFPVVSMAGPRHQDEVRDARGNVVVDSNGGCVRTKWLNDHPTNCHVGGKANSVYFQFNKASLTTEARATLDQIAAYIKDPNNNVRSINIVGYTDTIGGDSYNKRLSEKRAKHVKHYLASKGINGKHDTIEVRGLGKSNASNGKCDGLTGRAKIDCLWEERRVDIELNR